MSGDKNQSGGGGQSGGGQSKPQTPPTPPPNTTTTRDGGQGTQRPAAPANEYMTKTVVPKESPGDEKIGNDLLNP